METPKKEEMVSFSNSGLGSLTLICKSGRRMTWPYHLIGMSEYRPAGFDEDGTPDRDQEGLRINVGEELVIITGHDLLAIFTGLSELQGCLLTEFGERYAALRVKGKPYISKIDVKKLTTVEPIE